MSQREKAASQALAAQNELVEALKRNEEALEARVWPLLAAGDVAPLLHATFPLDQAAEAHRLMESSAHIGKIVLTTAAR